MSNSPYKMLLSFIATEITMTILSLIFEHKCPVTLGKIVKSTKHLLCRLLKARIPLDALIKTCSELIRSKPFPDFSSYA